MGDYAGLIGYTLGVLSLVTLIPAVVGGLFRRKTEPSTVWILIAWFIAGIVAYGGIEGGSPWGAQVLALAILGALTLMRLRAWKKSTH